MNYDSLLPLYMLTSIDGLGPQRIFNLMARFGSFENILEAGQNSLVQVELIDQTFSQKITSLKKQKASIEESLNADLEAIKKVNGDIVTYWDDDYPVLLRNIYYPPLILYKKGTLIEKDRYSIAIVGTRMPTPYGRVQADRFAGELAMQNIAVISGLARGIDSIAHAAAIKKGGRTIAVTGSGIDWIYPPENKRLYEEIAENGAVITEYRPGAKPDAQNFPRRNRIISGMSTGTLIIETKRNGGAMQTAAYALEQNREIFAIPGNINSPQSDGANRLIRDGEARLTINPEDILLDLELKLKPVIGKNIPADLPEMNLFEQKIYENLDTTPTQIDKISALVNMPTSDCLVHLLTLEFKGMVQQMPGKMFLRLG